MFFCTDYLISHLTALILQRSRNRQRETEDVSLDAAAQQRESIRHVVTHTLTGSNITSGEECLPKQEKHTLFIMVFILFLSSTVKEERWRDMWGQELNIFTGQIRLVTQQWKMHQYEVATKLGLQ